MKTSWLFARSRVLLLLFAAGVIAAVLGCPPTPPPMRELPRGPGAPPDSGPCPHYYSLFFPNRFPEGRIWKLAGPQLDVPEYNDCQRLLVNNSATVPPAHTDLKFGNVAAIFARANLNDVYHQESAIGTATGPFSVMLRNPNPATTRVTTIAFVWTTGSYAPLGLTEREFACVVLQWEPAIAPAENRTYHAWMVTVPPSTSCANPLDLPPSTAYYLGSVETPAEINSDGPDEIPPVARWDWDPKNGEQYIGIACPSGWCELYGEGRPKPHAHMSSPKYAVASALGIVGKAGRVMRQKGWYDEEYLASPLHTAGAPPVLDPTGAFGTIFPVPELKDRKITDYKKGKFVPVALISIDTVSAGYLEKYGIRLNRAPPKRRDVNVLSLCLDDGNKVCKPRLKQICSPTRDKSTGYLFYARLSTGPDDDEGRDFCVEYIGTDPKISTPGTVRWRWLDNDQTVWVSCPSGCCQIKPPQ